MAGEAEPWQIALDVDASAAGAAFAVDRIWNAYAIADLEPPFLQHARVALAGRPGAPPAASCLVLRHPAFTATIVDGQPAALSALLQAVDLPAETHLMVRDEHRSLVNRHYALPDGWREMLRMAVDAETFRSPAEGVPPARRLSPADLPDLLDLYTGYPENAFHADQLASGVFFGIRDGLRLMAAGGTHVVAPGHAIAAVGNIYTRPEARGRGLATIVTAAITGDLLHDGCRDVVLNVRTDNAPAIAVYRRLGYRGHCTYWEGHGVWREEGRVGPESISRL